MTEAKQPEALRLADRLQNAVATYPQLSEDEPGGYASEMDQAMDEAAAELRRQHARIADLEAQLSAIGAGGVEPLRPRQCLHGISEPSGWRDIETAPKDGTAVLVYPSTWDDRTCSTASWESDRYAKKPRPYWRRDDDLGRVNRSREALTTHWMPMPLPPSPSSADEGGSNG